MMKSIVTYYDVRDGVQERVHDDVDYVATDDNSCLVLLDENGGTVALYPKGCWTSYRTEA